MKPNRTFELSKIFYIQFAMFINMQYWIPEASVFIKPAPLGLDILLVGSDVNFKVQAQLTVKEEDDTDMPEMITL